MLDLKSTVDKMAKDIQYKPISGRDSYGFPSVGQNVTIKASLQIKESKDEVSQGMAVLYTTYSVEIGGVVSSNGKSYRINKWLGNYQYEAMETK